MKKAILIVDSNSYLRLARHVPSLLGDHGDYALRVIADFDKEYLLNTRLRTQFTWTNEPPHPDEREKWTLEVTKLQVKEIRESFATTRDFAEASVAEKFAYKRKDSTDGTPLPILSRRDVSLLCHALALEAGILTDEGPLTLAAKDLDVPVVSSLEILRHLKGLKVVDKAKVEAIVRFWQYDKDTPSKTWIADYTRLFKIAPPTTS